MSQTLTLAPASRACFLSFVLVLFLPPAGVAQGLTYIESSNGLEVPQFEGGDTEFEMGDVNGDGHIDLVSVGDHGNPLINTDQEGIIVWFGDGAGTWSMSQGGRLGYGGVALGDVNGDGSIDIGYGIHHAYSSTDLGDQLLEVALGDGTGTAWGPWDDGLAQEGQSWGLFSTDFADLDGDGDLDIGSMGFGASDGLQVYLNQGDGSWKRSFGFIGGNSDHVFVFGDVNNDGHADIATAKQEGTVWLGDGEGFFTVADGNLPELPAFGTRDGPSLGDVDHDGRDDLAFCSEEANAEVWLSRGDGTWEDVSATIPQTGQCQHTQLHDMNGDGHLDAVTFGSGNVYVYGGDGHGQSWSTLAHFTTPDSPGSSRCFRVGGDVDHNGRADMVLVNTKQLSLFDTRNIKHAYREASMAQELSIRIVQPGAGRRLHAGSAAFIDWAAEVPLGSTATVSLELSTSGPAGSWMPIATSVPNSGRHQWIVPAAFSDACHLRLTLDTGSSQASVVSPSRFEIARRPDPLSLRISAAGELSWDDALDRVRFNLYRGDWQQFLQTGMYTQAPDSVPDAARWCDLEETTQADPLAPPAGLLVYYLVTGYREMEDGQQPGVPVPMAEGVLGQRTDAVTRANAHPCPPRPLPP